MAKILDEGGIDAVLVGDSLGMTMQGRDSTLRSPWTRCCITAGVCGRGVQKRMVIGDMPFLSYQIDLTEAVRNAGRLVQEGAWRRQAGGRKKDGGNGKGDRGRADPRDGAYRPDPQSVHMFGGFKVQGKEESRARELIDDAMALEDAGVFFHRS
jgi:3-methyl-2-oxobutanoate hydroxymethyltransferase